MALEPAITDLEQLKDRPELARLLAWKADAVQGAKFDRNELSIYIERTFLREACTTLKNDPELNFDALADLTCVDWEPSDPRFEVIYHLFSTVTKKRASAEGSPVRRRRTGGFAHADLAGSGFL